jgi:hypothetical protein
LFLMLFLEQQAIPHIPTIAELQAPFLFYCICCPELCRISPEKPTTSCSFAAAQASASSSAKARNFLFYSEAIYSFRIDIFCEMRVVQYSSLLICLPGGHPYAYSLSTFPLFLFASISRYSLSRSCRSLPCRSLRSSSSIIPQLQKKYTFQLDISRTLCLCYLQSRWYHHHHRPAFLWISFCRYVVQL